MTAHARPFLTIVSGLPRSGTSLMMKMLEAGGMDALTDNIRTADIDNPRGYYEFEPVKQTKNDASWIDASIGKAVKMVYLLLLDLPVIYEYRVVFMRRNLDEVLASQKTMLERLGKTSPLDDAKMAALFRDQLAKFDAWVKDRPYIKLLDVSYNETVANPGLTAEIVNAFIGGLDVPAMANTVDPTLYRNRVK